MTDLISRFDRWRQMVPAVTGNLVQRVLDELVPPFEQAGFGRYGDYAGGNPDVVGANCLPIQRRVGPCWPTVEIQFDRRRRPSFNVVFAALPEACVRQSASGAATIQRFEANVTEGTAHFLLCKGRKRQFDCTFGVRGLHLFVSRQLDVDMEHAFERSKYLIRLLEAGLPPEWLDFPAGYVSEFVFKMRSLAPLRQPDR